MASLVGGAARLEAAACMSGRPSHGATAAVARLDRRAAAKAPLFGSSISAAARGSSSRQRSTVVRASSALLGEAELPANYAMYETMVVLRPNMEDEERDTELARFEAFLKKDGARDIRVNVRGRQRLAYPIKRFGEGIYVLYTYASGNTTAQAVQKYLSTPEAGAELNVLRHMTFRV